MRSLRFVIPLIFLTGCAAGVSGGQFVNVDGYRIDVAYEGGRDFAASGGESTHDKWVKYRQMRAIEVISLCRISSSHSAGGVLYATVDCAHPRTRL